MSVVVRFAPAPTGHLHVGSVRTALFNWLFAKKHGGRFHLRIDDTDRERSRTEYEEEIVAGLRWLGLDWDPQVLRQSEREAEYRAAVDRLDPRYRYEDFSTDEEVLEERKRAMAAHRVPLSPWRDREVSSEERERLLAEGRQAAVRFRVPKGETITITDLIRGEISFSTDQVEDYVLLRRDGAPSYQLTTVVDDAAQGMTHIIRGEDHVANIPKQILLMRALGYDVPQYAHLPLVLGPDGQKLSKRHGGTRVEELKGRGLLPEAVVNHLALVGWSSADGNEVFTPEELIAAFDLSRVNMAAASYDETKLIFLNGHHLHHLEDARIVAHLAELGMTGEPLGLTAEEWAEAVSIVRSSAHDLLELGVMIRDLFAPVSAFSFKDEAELVLREKSGGLLESILDLLNEGPLDLKQIQKDVKAKLGVSGKNFFMPVRAAWTGMTHGPELVRLMNLLGRERLIERTQKAIEKFGA